MVVCVKKTMKVSASVACGYVKETTSSDSIIRTYCTVVRSRTENQASFAAAFRTSLSHYYLLCIVVSL